VEIEPEFLAELALGAAFNKLCLLFPV